MNNLLLEMLHKRNLILELSINDFKARFSSSFLGTVWAVVQPLTNILVFWFVFQVGLRNGDVDGRPFIVWYIPAYLIWTFFSDSFSASSNSIREYSYLVKKVNFPVFIIPIVKVLSSLFVHVFFLFFIILINACYKIYPTIYYVQVFYYLFCTMVLLVGLSWLFSALGAIIPDIINIVNVVLQIGFWATPIIWNPNNLSPTVGMILKVNPLYYICQGYRDTFIYGRWFWEDIGLAIYFWFFTLLILVLGIYTFRNLQPRYADVL